VTIIKYNAMLIRLTRKSAQPILACKNGHRRAFTNLGGYANPSNIPHALVTGRYNDVRHTEAVLNSELAAIVFRHMQVAGGLIPATKEFLTSVREAATRTGALFHF
jgi:acetylornithine/succinyldiaminopimelate/putrescine aminotransferase